MMKTPLWFLLLSSFVLKILVILADGAHYNLHSDDAQYLETARIWLKTGMFTYNDPTRPTVFITPGYPAFVALLMKLAGDGAVLRQTIRIVQTMIVTFSLYMLYLIGKTVFNKEVAVGAVAISAFFPPLWLVSNLILTEALFLLGLVLLVYCALRIMERPSAVWAAAFGLAWAFSVYIRPTIALWPGIFFLLLLFWRYVSWKQFFKYGMISSVILAMCLAPWWVRNYQTAGSFIPLTKAGGNPLLLGTFPFIPPSLEEQRTWHTGNDLWVNDELDGQRAVQRIKDGFARQPLVYLLWYTVGKFAYFWGDVYYWVSLLDIPLIIVILYHYVIMIPGFMGVWEYRGSRQAMLLVSLFGYMTLLHMIYLAHSRYAIPLVPFMSLFTAAKVLQVGRARNRTAVNQEARS
jgi:4-amino-4-deoxy-L-arabinose transferase-like glycosyltransferase